MIVFSSTLPYSPLLPTAPKSAAHATALIHWHPSTPHTPMFTDTTTQTALPFLLFDSFFTCAQQGACVCPGEISQHASLSDKQHVNQGLTLFSSEPTH